MEQWGAFMDLDKKRKIASISYRPYRKEALHCLGIFICILLTLSIPIALLAYTWDSRILAWFILLTVGYIVVDCILIYRLSLISVYENKKCDWSIQKLTITKISQEFSWAFHWSADGISRLYPKELHFDKYKVVCKNEMGSRVVLRTAISGKKYQIIQNRLFENLDTTCTIYYGKHSKIIMLYKSNKTWTDQLNSMA